MKQSSSRPNLKSFIDFFSFLLGILSGILYVKESKEKSRQMVIDKSPPSMLYGNDYEINLKNLQEY